MSMSSQGFHYSLNALLRKRRSECDAAKAELAAARAQMECRIKELELARSTLEQLDNLQRDLCQQGELIDIDARMRLHLCVRTTVATLNEHAEQLEQASRRLEAALDRVNATRQAVRVLEVHRDSRKMLFDTECARKEHAVLDELYLVNKGSRSLAIAVIGK